MSLDKKYIDLIVEVTSKAAISSSKFIGKKNKNSADQAAVSAMREELNKLNINGSVGAAEGEAIIYGVQHAIDNRTPYVFFPCGGGQRMFESPIALANMTRTTLAINELKENNLPYLVCLLDPTAGGITASYAMLGDFHIAEPGALIAFAGARVIQGTVKEELPEGFQKSEYVEKTGFVDLIVERKNLSEKIGTLLSILLKQNSVISSEQNETSEDSQSLTRAAS